MYGEKVNTSPTQGQFFINDGVKFKMDWLSHYWSWCRYLNLGYWRNPFFEKSYLEMYATNVFGRIAGFVAN